MASTRRVDLELVVFAGDRLDGVDLAELEPDQLEPRLALARVHRGTRQPLPALANPRPQRGHRRGLPFETGVGIEKAEVRGGIEQRLVLVLAVQLDEVGRHLAQHRGGGQRAVDERPAPPGCGDLPADQDLAAVRPLEDRLDGRGVGAGADQVGRGAAAQQEPDRFDEDGLARPGLAGEGGEARIEVDLNGFDHRQVADAKRTQHVGGTSIVSYV